ncbi:hypothetical protein [Mesorhizobium sp. B2-6-4]|uniref:hypothetical protein n=1 Tax=Mesorhizobium sp. B2-6-4 TaxID=2589913 RepID=UPI00112BD679|nr:hypothetical protein [Mesorhizobium sp. B2-6-4]TPJ52738.1 hypothetical protein FJ426_15925 [Mesorhizobium sp. B2-6-4]
MADEQRRASKADAKSQTLTIRLDLKTKFMLEFVSRLRGQNITTVVERAVATVAGAETIPRGGQFEPDLTWQALWSVSEGVRTLRVADVPELFPTYEEERRLAFAKEHWPFFYTNRGCRVLQQFYVDVLWPRIEDFISLHEAKRHENYFGAGQAMQEALRAAKLQAPEWPVKPEPATPPTPKTSGRDLDDEIPF